MTHAPDTGWEQAALCCHPDADPSWWDHDGTKHPDAKKAVAWCRACPVRAACLADAMATEGGKPSGLRQGIRGGLGVRERAALYRQRKKRAATATAKAAA